ncbi:MAG TPA: carboxypeptidase regulatory-like domain-containing protein [Pyrinomonadaceae bacterium]|nr:carboxypeptidase regulatory-like domain-containing protein [Pyrinomonadaceae bacterium]
MSFSAHCLPAVLLTILSLPISLPAQTTPKQTSKTLRGSISGRVTIKEKGAAGVVVSLRTSDVMNVFERLPRATTDADGFYRIPNVVPGSYDVTPVAPAFVPADAKEQRSKSVLVGEDENIESINFTLVRGGVITGRVTDADGRPVIQQQVFIYRADAFDQQSQPQSQQRAVFAMSGAQTDDRGIYRVFGLLPGRYKVGAGRSDDVFTPGFSGSSRSVYKQVFHPDVTEQSKATVIEVGEGTEASNADITLGRALQTFTIAGRVVDGERGLPAPDIRLGVQRVLNQRVEFVSTSVNSNAQGDFVIEGLIPGKYGLYLFPNQNSGMRLETVTFDIIDQDLSGLSVKLIKGASLSGVVAVDTEDRAVLAKFSELQLRAYVANPTAGSGGGMGSSASSPINPDGSFYLTGLPGGTVSLNLGSKTGPFPPKGLSLVRVEREGVSLAHGIELREGEQLTGLRLVLAYGTATIRGVVKLENGTLPEGARIFVRLTKPSEQLSNLALPTVDARGHFLIEGIQGGTYQIHALIGGPHPVLPPRMVRREITVQDGVTTDVTLTIDMSAPPKP